MVEAVRVGSIIARDAKAAAKWRSRTVAGSQGLTGAALDAAVSGIAARTAGDRYGTAGKDMGPRVRTIRESEMVN